VEPMIGLWLINHAVAAAILRTITKPRLDATVDRS
jgi:hypothetical protein